MILLTLSRGKGEETVRLQLPASPAEIGETFAFLDRISLDTTATAILDVSSNVPVLYRCLYDVDVEDSEQFQKLQKLAERTEALSPAKAAIFSGALDAECVWNLEGALTVADRLDEYMRSNFSLIEQAHRRLAKVVIENKDFEKLLHQYDRPVSFFYLDPPYHATEGYYQNIGEDGFTEADHIRLRDALMRIEGKFLLSYNDDAFVRGLYDRPGIYLMETTRINNIKQRYDNGAQFPELLIANYDLRERSRAVPSQMTLFDWNGAEAIG